MFTNAEFSRNVTDFSSRIKFFSAAASEIRNGWIKVKLSPWRSIASRTPVTAGNDGDCRGMHVKRDKPSSRLVAKNTDWRVDLLERSFVRVWWGLMEGPPDEGASRGSHHRADSEKSAKLMLGSECLVEGMHHRSFVLGEVYGLKCRFSSLAITCTFNGKYRWHETQTPFPFYFYQSSCYPWIFFDQFTVNLFLIKGHINSFKITNYVVCLGIFIN